MSDAARTLRLGMRAALGCCGLSLVAAYAAAKGWLPAPIGAAALPLFLGAGIIALWLGLKAQRRALADRDKQSGSAMIVAIAAQLGKQDDATLEQIRAKGGPAGEAASLILGGRRAKAKGER
jgi:hypothetical protein